MYTVTEIHGYGLMNNLLRDSSERTGASSPPADWNAFWTSREGADDFPPPSGAEVEVGIGSVLSGTLSLLIKKPVLFLGLSLVASLPCVVIRIIVGGTWRVFLMAEAIGDVSSTIIQGAFSYAVCRSLSGKTVGIGEALARGTIRFLPLLGIAIIILFYTSISILPILIIPSFMRRCMWWVAVPVCATERLDAIESLGRSSELTNGYRWTVFVLMIIFSGTAAAVAYGAASIVLPAFNRESLILNFALLQMTIEIVNIIPQTFQNAMIAVIYYKLRYLKEGISVSRLANQ